MIRSATPWVDRFAITVSLLCIAHCLLMPLLLVVLPSLGNSMFGSEALHYWLVYAVIPSSLFALGIGCTQHRRGSFILMGLLGVCFLVFGITVESVGLKHIWEQIFTVLGALLIAVAHVRNFLQCREHSDCTC